MRILARLLLPRRGSSHRDKPKLSETMRFDPALSFRRICQRRRVFDELIGSMGCVLVARMGRAAVITADRRGLSRPPLSFAGRSQ